MTGKASRRRGADFERATVAYLREHGYPHAERAPGGREQPGGDVLGVAGAHIECKNRARLDLAEWIDAAAALADPAGALPVVIVKRRGTADPGQAYAVLRLADLARVLS